MSFGTPGDRMTTSSRLLSLAPETRNQIWEELFSSGEDIVLYRSTGALQRRAAYAEKKEVRATQSDEDSSSDDYEIEGPYGVMIRARCPLPVHCLRVSQQVREECTIAMFRNKSIRFDTVEGADDFLMDLPHYQQRQIHHLIFGRLATGSDTDENMRDWETIPYTIANMRSVRTVTLWAPSEEYEALCDWYHWPAGKDLVKMLLEGGIDTLRIYLSNETNLIHDHFDKITQRYRESGPVLGEGYKLAPNVAPTDIEAILEICYPWTKQEELKEFTRANAELKKTDKDAFWDMWEVYWPEKKSQTAMKVDLRREESQRDGEGTVIVITRPQR
ncbi:MAG: hypothetical protein Q9168_004495 [Polycauliona sp. 1 TL-2023]